MATKGSQIEEKIKSNEESMQSATGESSSKQMSDYVSQQGTYETEKKPVSREELAKMAISDLESYLKKWKAHLKMLRAKDPPDLYEVGEARITVEEISKELSDLKYGHSGGSENTQLPQDNQSLLQTSSVRKKDAQALINYTYDNPVYKKK